MKTLRAFVGNPDATLIACVFALLSLNFSIWLSNIERIQRKFELSDSMLGLELLGIAIGLLSMNIGSSYVIRWLGPNKTVVFALTFLPLSMLLVFWARTPLLLFFALCLLGAVNAVLNISMNSVANTIEDHYDQPIISICHGFWSLGLVFGSLIAMISFANGWSYVMQVGITSLLIILGLVWFWHRHDQLPEKKMSREEKAFAWPTRYMVVLIIIGIIFGLAEGSALDWSGVYLKQKLGASETLATLGFGLFALSQGVFRISGQGLISKYGNVPILISCALIGAMGYAYTILFRQPQIGLWGFFIVGAGCSLAFPVLYKLSMESPNMSPSAGLATFATFSFIGIMFGPAIVGFISEHFSLFHAFGFVSISLLGTVLLSRKV